MHKNCPNCGEKWEHDETITETFKRLYTKEGVPSYLREQGIIDIDQAAAHTAEHYGDTPDTPRHFGTNHIAITLSDRVEWWGCTSCGAITNRFTGKIYPKNEYTQMLLDYHQ
jgi:hypothetical protein